MFSILKAREETGFTQPINLHELRIRQKFSNPADQLRRHWRSAVREHLKAGQIVRVRFGELSQKIDHGRDENGIIHSLFRDHLAEGFRLEACKRNLARAEHWRRKHRGEGGDMKRGGGGEEYRR